MNSVVLYHHLGLGDHFVCNGLVHKVSKDFDLIYLPCKVSNYPTVKYLYSESSKIKVFKINNDEFCEISAFASLMNLMILIVGFQNCEVKNWDRSFYNQLGIDFSERYNSFYLPNKKPDVLMTVPLEDYILIHDESSVGAYKLNIESDLKFVKIERGLSDNLFSFIDIIKNAKEIHCINSSVFHLIDSLNETTDKLFYHDIRRTDDSEFKVSGKWKIIRY
jgi:hypothetical protein